MSEQGKCTNNTIGQSAAGNAAGTAEERLKSASERYAACPMKPLGIIRTPFPEPKGTPLEPSRAAGARGTVWIDPLYREALLDLEGFDRVWLLFWLHKAPEGKPLVTPFLDVQQHGLFATRAPARFNPIGLSAVRLLEVHEDRIEVGDIDIVDGTPLLDIKPYVPEFDSFPDSRSGWFAANRNPLTVADDRFMIPPPGTAKETAYLSIGGMKCPKCVDRIQKTLIELKGVLAASVVMGSATVQYDPSAIELSAIFRTVSELGFPSALDKAIEVAAALG